MAKQQEEKNKVKRTLQGIVSNVSGSKTIKVRIESKFRHPLYGKIIKRHKNYLVHIEDENQVEPGDEVIIQEDKKRSRKKGWAFLQKVN